MDFFSNISPSIVLALGAKWFTAFGTGLQVSAAVIEKKGKPQYYLLFFTFYLILHLKLQSSFFDTFHFCSAIILFLINTRRSKADLL